MENLNSIKIINMKENRGHARCNASGLKYIFENEEFDYVIPMDGDGEDRPEEIKQFIDNLNSLQILDISDGKIVWIFEKVFPFLFSYKIPIKIKNKLKIGMRVKAPLGSRVVQGIVVDIKPKIDFKGQLRSIKSLVDDKLDAEMPKLYCWTFPVK